MAAKLCLNMIVKNEGQIIRRLLESVYKHIDCYVIVDTCSTDDTVSIIESFFNEKGIPGKIVVEPFKNFSYNRNHALSQVPLDFADFTLLCDADMLLEISPTFNLQNFLTQELEKGHSSTSYDIVQGNNSFYYRNTRIIRNNGQFKYEGVTHEYIDVLNPDNVHTSLEKSDIFMPDIGDGGSKSDKFERDIRLLVQGLIDEPQHKTRYTFYLANSYHDLGRFEEAIPIYRERIRLGGWKEEVWYSYYRIGLCYKGLNKMNEAILTWLDGYEFYPDRLEGLYEIMHYYRVQNKHKLGVMIYYAAKRILDLNLPIDKHLFCHPEIYLYKIYYEYSIMAYYVGINNVNREIMCVLNTCRDDLIINNVLNNLKFYSVNLVPIETINFDDVIVKDGRTFHSSSSCLLRDNTNKYVMNVRYVNYSITPRGEYLGCEKGIISLNKYLELDKNFQPIKEHWFEEDLLTARLYKGIEDIRIFEDDHGEMLFLGTGFHANDTIGIVMGEYNIEEPRLEPVEFTQSFAETKCEKNWSYIGGSKIVYKWFPLTICDIVGESRTIVPCLSKEMPQIFARVRGSSSSNMAEKELWFVNHIVSHETPRNYYHMISVFDENMNLLRYSTPFKFEGQAIEFCLSIVVEEKRVLMNYSTWDRTTRIGIYDKDYIESLLIA